MKITKHFLYLLLLMIAIFFSVYEASGKALSTPNDDLNEMSNSKSQGGISKVLTNKRINIDPPICSMSDGDYSLRPQYVIANGNTYSLQLNLCLLGPQWVVHHQG